MEDVLNYDVCIIGGGISGMFLSAKIANNKQSVLLLEADKNFGGQMNLYLDKSVFNIALIDEIKSQDIVKKLHTNIEKNQNCKILLNTNITKLEKQTKEKNTKQNEEKEIQNNETFIITATTIKENIQKEIKIQSKYVILACGNGKNIPNKIQVDNAENYENKTLFYSVVDKKKFQDKNIVIAGGGDSVIDWSVELSKIAKTITIIHRREISKPDNPEFTTFQTLYKNENSNIKIKIPFVIKNIIGNKDEGIIKQIEISNQKDNTNEIINCDYLLAFYGLKTIQTNIEIDKNINIQKNQNGFIVNFATCETSEKNIFAIGDCCYYENKIKNIPTGFFEAMKCYHEICKREKNIFCIH